MKTRIDTIAHNPSPADCALEAMTAGWNEETIATITKTFTHSKRTAKTAVYTAQWDDDPSYVMTAYVQEFDAELDLYRVIVTTG